MHPYPQRRFAPFPPASSHPSLPPLHPDLPSQRSSSPDAPVSAHIGPHRVRSGDTRPSGSRLGPQQLDALNELHSLTSNPTGINPATEAVNEALESTVRFDTPTVSDDRQANQVPVVPKWIPLSLSPSRTAIAWDDKSSDPESESDSHPYHPRHVRVH